MTTGPANPTVDVAEIGRVSAQLSDWQTITFFLMAIIAMLILERAWAAYSFRKEREAMAHERERMWAVSEKFGEAADKLGERTHQVVTELEVNRALNARTEQVMAGLESRVAELASKVSK